MLIRSGGYYIVPIFCATNPTWESWSEFMVTFSILANAFFFMSSSLFYTVPSAESPAQQKKNFPPYLKSKNIYSTWYWTLGPQICSAFNVSKWVWNILSQNFQTKHDDLVDTETKYQSVLNLFAPQSPACFHLIHLTNEPRAVCTPFDLSFLDCFKIEGNRRRLSMKVP